MSYDHNPKALEMIRELFKERGMQRVNALWELDAEFARLFEDFTYGGMYQRTVLSQKVRELCAVAGVVCLGWAPQIYNHVAAALNAGATRAEVQEVILQMMVYAGAPATLHGVEQMRKVFADRDAEERRPAGSPGDRG